MENKFQQIFDAYNTGLLSGVSAVINSGLTAVAPILSVVMVLFVAVFGYLTLTGEMTASDAIGRMLRLVLTQALLTPVYYNAYVTDVVLDWLPNWIAGAVGTGTGADASAAQFDELTHQIIVLQQTLAKQVDMLEVAKGLMIYGLGFLCQMMIALTFFVFVFTRAILALVVALGLFVIIGNLFAATRGFFEGWIGKLGGMAILLVLISILLRIITAQFGFFMGLARQDAEFGLDRGIDALVSILIVMVFGVSLLVALPGVAFAIGGRGASFSPLGGAAGMASIGSGLGGGAKAAGAKAKAGAGAAGARIAHLGRMAAARFRTKS